MSRSLKQLGQFGLTDRRARLEADRLAADRERMRLQAMSNALQQIIGGGVQSLAVGADTYTKFKQRERDEALQNLMLAAPGQLDKTGYKTREIPGEYYYEDVVSEPTEQELEGPPRKVGKVLSPATAEGPPVLRDTADGSVSDTGSGVLEYPERTDKDLLEGMPAPVLEYPGEAKVSEVERVRKRRPSTFKQEYKFDPSLKPAIDILGEDVVRGIVEKARQDKEFRDAQMAKMRRDLAANKSPYASYAAGLLNQGASKDVVKKNLIGMGLSPIDVEAALFEGELKKSKLGKESKDTTLANKRKADMLLPSLIQSIVNDSNKTKEELKNPEEILGLSVSEKTKTDAINKLKKQGLSQEQAEGYFADAVAEAVEFKGKQRKYLAAETDRRLRKYKEVYSGKPNFVNIANSRKREYELPKGSFTIDDVTGEKRLLKEDEKGTGEDFLVAQMKAEEATLMKQAGMTDEQIDSELRSLVPGIANDQKPMNTSERNTKVSSVNTLRKIDDVTRFALEHDVDIPYVQLIIEEYKSLGQEGAARNRASAAGVGSSPGSSVNASDAEGFSKSTHLGLWAQAVANVERRQGTAMDADTRQYASMLSRVSYVTAQALSGQSGRAFSNQDAVQWLGWLVSPYDDSEYAQQAIGQMHDELVSDYMKGLDVARENAIYVAPSLEYDGGPVALLDAKGNLKLDDDKPIIVDREDVPTGTDSVSIYDPKLKSVFKTEEYEKDEGYTNYKTKIEAIRKKLLEVEPGTDEEAEVKNSLEKVLMEAVGKIGADQVGKLLSNWGGTSGSKHPEFAGKEFATVFRHYIKLKDYKNDINKRIAAAESEADILSKLSGEQGITNEINTEISRFIKGESKLFYTDDESLSDKQRAENYKKHLFQLRAAVNQQMERAYDELVYQGTLPESAPGLDDDQGGEAPPLERKPGPVKPGPKGGSLLPGLLPETKPNLQYQKAKSKYANYFKQPAQQSTDPRRDVLDELLYGRA